MDRANTTFKNGKYSILESLCYAEFLAWYVLDTKLCLETENDNQPEVLLDDNDNENLLCLYPKLVPLMNSKDRLKLKKHKTCCSIPYT